MRPLHRIMGLTKDAQRPAACNEPTSAEHDSRCSQEAAIVAKSTPSLISPKSIERFWNKVDMSAGQSGCWLWTGRIHTASGYGTVSFTANRVKKVHQAHRIAYAIAAGVIVPGDLSVCHSCDNRRCCNPSHLWLGTHQENMRDRDQKGRHYRGGAHVPLRGAQCARAKLTEQDVISIRRRYKRGVYGLKRLANDYGVHAMTIKAIVTGKSWAHVGDAG